MRGGCQALLKDLDIFFPIHGNRNRLTKLLVALALFRRLAFADDRIHPVKAEVRVLRFYGLRKLQLLFFVLFFLFRAVGHADQEAPDRCRDVQSAESRSSPEGTSCEAARFPFRQ